MLRVMSPAIFLRAGCGRCEGAARSFHDSNAKPRLRRLGNHWRLTKSFLYLTPWPLSIFQSGSDHEGFMMRSKKRPTGDNDIVAQQPSSRHKRAKTDVENDNHDFDHSFDHYLPDLRSPTSSVSDTASALSEPFEGTSKDAVRVNLAESSVVDFDYKSWFYKALSILACLSRWNASSAGLCLATHNPAAGGICPHGLSYRKMLDRIRGYKWKL